MRKVTKLAVEAFYTEKPFKQDNTEIKIESLPNGKQKVSMLLFDHLIAYRTVGHGLMYITAAGHKTNTTKERLNGLRKVSLAQKDSEWYLNGQKWNGDMIGVIM